MKIKLGWLLLCVVGAFVWFFVTMNVATKNSDLKEQLAKAKLSKIIVTYPTVAVVNITYSSRVDDLKKSIVKSIEEKHLDPKDFPKIDVSEVKAGEVYTESL